MGLAPASLVLCGALFYALRWPMPGVAAVALLVLLVSIWIGPLLDRARSALDRDLLQLLATGKTEALGPRIASERLFRWLGSPGDVSEREGRARRAVGDAQGALRAYRRAVDGYDDGRAPLSAIAGLGHAAYEAGEPELARDALDAALVASPGLPEVAVRLAHLRLLAGEEVELSIAEEGETAVLVRAWLALRDGDPAPAREALRTISKDPTASWARARADLSAALDESAPPKKSKKPKKR